MLPPPDHCLIPSRLWTRRYSRKEELAAVAAAKSILLCLTRCDPIDGSPPGSPMPGILQARILEWVARKSLLITNCHPDNPTDMPQKQWQGRATPKVRSNIAMKVILEKKMKKDPRNPLPNGFFFPMEEKERRKRERKYTELNVSGWGLKLSLWKFFFEEGSTFLVTFLKSIDLCLFLLVSSEVRTK